MTCQDLKDKLDTLCKHGHAEDEVVIVLADKSLGAHASSGIESVFAGFDWDRGKILVRPTKSVVSEERSRDVPQVKVLWHDVLHCPHCERRITKSAKYCIHCGQKLSKEVINLDEHKSRSD